MGRVLIIDDSLIMRDNLKNIFIQAGHQVVGEGTDGLQAISLYEQLLPDLVTMDITMPNMNGIEAAKKIISLYPDAKIIMISANNQKQLLYEAVKEGAKHYIIKPVTIEKVISVTKTIMRDSKKEHEQTHQLQPLFSPKPVVVDESITFTITNQKGTFYIDITEHPNGHAINLLEGVIQQFRFVNSLDVILRIFELQNPSVHAYLINLINKLFATDSCTLQVLTNDQFFLDSLQEVNSHIKVYPLLQAK